MKYKGDDYQMCDAWFLNVGGRVHAFNLKLPDENGVKNVAHTYTDDLLHFHKCADFLDPFPETVNADDCNDHGTGCALTDPETGTHYIYYTMLNMARDQKIGLVTTDDLTHFTYCDKNPVLVPDPAVFAQHLQFDKGTDCRDMIVVFDEKTKLYYGYFAAMANVNGRGNVGVIGVAESSDLILWQNQSIAYTAPFDGVIEVPDVYFLDGKWYLTVLTHTTFGARGDFCDPNVVSGTLYASSDSPKGPFAESADNVFIGGTFKSGYTCRTVGFCGKRYVMYIDKSEYGWAVSLPKEVKIVGGRLRPCYTDILQKLRINKAVSAVTEDMLDKKSPAWVWQTGSAKTRFSENGFTIETNPFSYQYYTLKNVNVQSAEICCYVTSNGADCGFVIETSQNAGEGVKEFFVIASPREKTLSVYAGGNSLRYTWTRF